MRFKYFARVLFAVLVLGSPADAHRQAADLDELMGSKERFFQVIDRSAPSFELRDAEGNTVALSDFTDKIVVLQFVYATCPDICPLHAEKLADIQEMINQTPMKEMVRFISVTTDPENDTPDILKTYGPAHGLDPVNWRFLTTKPDQDEGATRALAEAFGHTFAKSDDGYQTHGVVTHIIDRNSRWAANFHGLKFEPVNMVLYINGLTNNPHAPVTTPRESWWERVMGLF